MSHFRSRVRSVQNQDSVQVPERKLPNPRFRRLVIPALSIAAGLLIGMAWQEMIPGPLGISGLGLFFYVQSVVNSRRGCFASSLVSGLVASLVACPWLIYTVKFLSGTSTALSVSIAVGVALFHSTVFVAFAMVFRLAGRYFSRPQYATDSMTPSPGPRPHSMPPFMFFAAPAIWVLIEHFVPMLFPFSIGCLLADYPSCCQLAELGGGLLVSFFAATMALLVPLSLDFLCNRRNRSGSLRKIGLQTGSIFLLGAAIIGWGSERIRQCDDQTRFATVSRAGLSLLVVQAETESAIANRRMVKASQQAGGMADLVVWPECALGKYNQTLTDFSNARVVAENAIGQNTRFQPFPDPTAPLLAGGDTWLAGETMGKPKANFVSAFLIDRNEKLQGRHDKVSLMPYGEYIPGESLFPPLRKWFGNTRIISRGSTIKPVGKVENVTLGVLLCCEDMHPLLFRSLSVKGADLLISLGNGMAFDSEIALRQHFRISRFRAIENRKHFVRCTSRGVSALVSPSGKIVVELPAMEDGAMLIRVPKSGLQATPFTKYGYLPSYAVILASCGGWGFFARRASLTMKS